MPKSKKERSNEVNILILEAMQSLATARASKTLSENADGEINIALEKLGRAFALTRESNLHDENSSLQRLDRVFIENERFFSSVTSNPDLDLICLETDSVPAVHAAPGQLEQVLLASLLAQRELAGGAKPMTVSIGTVTVNGENIESITPLRAGRYASISIQSTARMGDTHMLPTPYDEVFESAEEAETTASGLGNVYRVVTSLDGSLVCDTSDSMLPVLTMFLPLAKSLRATGTDDSARESREHNETVLLVDDDAMVRRYTRRSLEASGFHVLEASDSREALERVREENGHIDVLIADLVLPDMHGGKLARALEEEFGTIPVIFVSGYDNRAIQHHGLIDQGANLLRKPFTRRSLLKMLDLALDANISA